MQNIISNDPSRQIIEEIANFIVQEAPTLKELNINQLKEIGQLVLTQRLATELNTEVNIAGIDYNKEKNSFIDNAGRCNSNHTKKVYKDALYRLEIYTKKENLKLFLLTPAQADDFIYALKVSGKAPATINKLVAGCSSFFTFLERRHRNIVNPFRGTKARPQKQAIRKIDLPTKEEVETILIKLKYEKPTLYCAVLLMSSIGLRAGALPMLKIKGNRYESISKGKNIFGVVPENILNDIKNNITEWKTPFKNFTVNAIEKAVTYCCLKLHKEGIISTKYSCHDFRHFFAIERYEQNKDIYRLSKLMHHSNIQVTETYLKSLKILT